MTQTNRAGVMVRQRGEFGRARTERLTLREHLRVNFETDDRLVFV
jgi:hypothetical protein